MLMIYINLMATSLDSWPWYTVMYVHTKWRDQAAGLAGVTQHSIIIVGKLGKKRT